MTHQTLLVFVKWPAPGFVKTRLIPTLGAEAAAALYRAMADEELRRTAPLAGEYERLLFFAPAGARAEIERWQPGESCLPQIEGGLGARMLAAFDEAFRRGAERVAIIGTDVPWVSRDQVLRALSDLESRDVVLGPARDGGYYLLALERRRPALFLDVAWSTPSVVPQTLQQARHQGLRVGLLETLPDIDTVADLRREWARLRPLLRDESLVGVIEDALQRPTAGAEGVLG